MHWAQYIYLWLPAACLDARLSLLDVLCTVERGERRSLNGSEWSIFWFDDDFVSALSIVTAWIGVGKTVSDALRCIIGLSNGIDWKSTPSKSVVSTEDVGKFVWLLRCKSNKSFFTVVNVVVGGGTWFEGLAADDQDFDKGIIKLNTYVSLTKLLE